VQELVERAALVSAERLAVDEAAAAIERQRRLERRTAEDDKRTDPLTFETETELVVTRARLAELRAHDPASDRLDAGPGPLFPFNAQTPAIHELLIACPTILARPGAASWTVALEFANKPEGAQFTFHDETGAPIAAVTNWDNARLVATVAKPPALPTTTVAELEHAWLAARLVPRQGPPPTIPAVKSVRLAAQYAGDDIAPKKVLRGTTVLDTTTDIYPFGQDPEIGSSTAIDGGAAFGQPVGASIVVTVTLAAAVEPEAARPKARADLRLAWELLDASGAWIEIGRSSGTDSAILTDGKNPTAFVDDTFALTRPARVRFKLPFAVPDGKHGGKIGRWLRARIVAGDYEAGRAPLLARIRLGYTHTLEQVPAAMCVARDLGHTRAVGPLDGAGQPAQAFTVKPPGAPELGDRPALYLGFDRPFDPRPVQLFLDVLPPDPQSTQPPDQLPPVADVPRVVWEYHGPRGWTRLGVRDETRGLVQRGMLAFVAPPDLAAITLFGRPGAWLRARWLSGTFRAPPRLARAVDNAVWATHAATRRDEHLGSGTGSPGQQFKLVAAPVLAGERIEVRERERPSEREVADLRAELGDDAVVVERDAAGVATAAWVRWTPMTHFHGSGPADRHYVLDAETGVLTFGDGLSGRTLPRGRSNVRAAVYRTGGGTRGNRPAGAVSELKTAIPYVAGAVSVDAATGGTGREDQARVRTRGPKHLRHRGRAVTAADLEDLAFEAAPEIARAYALTVPFNPIDVAVDLTDPSVGKRDARGWIAGGTVPADTAAVAARAAEVRVVVVPRGDEDRPTPSLGLLQHVEAFLGERAPPAMRILACGPRWIRVTVRADVVAAPGAAADRLIDAMRAAITRFLHPLTGGEQGQGWDFGRIPRRSHLYRLLARFPGVGHIQSLALITDPPLPDVSESLSDAQRRALAGALVYSGAHELVLVGQAEES
jgi:predicted phage baseplate assembly protein